MEHKRRFQPLQCNKQWQTAPSSSAWNINCENIRSWHSSIRNVWSICWKKSYLRPDCYQWISITQLSLKMSGRKYNAKKISVCQHTESVIPKSDFSFIYCWPCISSNILVNNQPDALFRVFIYNFISLHVSSIKCSSSGDRIVLIHHLVWLVCVTAWYAGQEFPPDRHTK